MWPIIGVSWSGSISHISSWQEKNIYIQQSCWVTSKALHVIGSIINLSSFITVLVAECCRLFAPEAFTKWYAMISKSLLNLVLMSQHSINTNDFIWFPDTSRMSCWGWRHVIRRTIQNLNAVRCSMIWWLAPASGSQPVLIIPWRAMMFVEHVEAPVLLGEPYPTNYSKLICLPGAIPFPFWSRKWTSRAGHFWSLHNPITTHHSSIQIQE